jgi:antitoxin component YwqK of YwqJK toxin-antitoxin module
MHSCSTNRIKNGEREGLWVEKSIVNNVEIKSKGRYRQGFERKTWRYYENGELVKREKYKDCLCDVTHFRDGKIIRQGQTKLRVTGNNLHWFYSGDWKEYDDSGKLRLVSRYKEGELVEENEINN